MKKYIIIPLLLLMAAGCKNETYKAPVETTTPKETAEYQNLLNESQRKDSAISSYMQAFNEIEDNLSVIKEKQKIVSNAAQSGEIKKSKEEQIVADIKTINDLMVKNREKLASLNSRLKKGEIKMAEFQKMVDGLNRELDEKNNEIETLHEELANVNGSILKLTSDYNDRMKELGEKNDVIKKQTEDLHTGWYATGTYKELKEQGVVVKEGGVLGIGRDEKLMSNFNRDRFKKIDITTTTSIPVCDKESCKKARLITNHPSDSYKFEGEGKAVENLVITDPDKFWASSKYLVVDAE